jgi:hypothetical protein
VVDVIAAEVAVQTAVAAVPIVAAQTVARIVVQTVAAQAVRVSNAVPAVPVGRATIVGTVILVRRAVRN